MQISIHKVEIEVVPNSTTLSNNVQISGFRGYTLQKLCSDIFVSNWPSWTLGTYLQCILVNLPLRPKLGHFILSARMKI